MITQAELKEMVTYNPCTGEFHWRVNRIKVKTGDKAGFKIMTAYICIEFGKKQRYYAHRLAWLYIYGYWPNIIDHIDKKPWNNSIWNLSNGTRSANMKNSSNYKGGTQAFSRNRSANTRARYWQIAKSVARS